MSNGFWIEVISCWQEFSRKCKFESNSDILNSCIWYNQKLTKEPIYLPTWYKHGIYCVGDVVDSRGKIQSIDQLKNIYRFHINILDYYRVKLSVHDLIKKNKFGENFEYERPMHPFHLKVLMKSKKGCQDFYKILKTDTGNEPTAKIKWDAHVDLTIPNFWKIIYRICFKSVTDNEFKWFQYKIINNILATKYYLHKVKLSENNQCQLCNSQPKTISHLFSNCKQTEELWKNVKYWIFARTGMPISLTETEKILGYAKFDENFWPVNFILIHVRHYIYCCSKRQQPLNIFQLQKEIKSNYEEEKLVSKINDRNHLFEKRWIVWQNLFVNI